MAITLPLTVEQLGDGYSVFNYHEDTDGSIGGDIIYRDTITLENEFVAQVIFDENVTDSEHIKQKIKELNSSHKWFSVNGITSGSSKAEVQETFGEPFGKRKVSDDTIEVWYYCEDGKQEDDYYLRIAFNEDDTVYVIGVIPE